MTITYAGVVYPRGARIEATDAEMVRRLDALATRHLVAVDAPASPTGGKRGTARKTAFDLKE